MSVIIQKDNCLDLIQGIKTESCPVVDAGVSLQSKSGGRFATDEGEIIELHVEVKDEPLDDGDVRKEITTEAAAAIDKNDVLTSTPSARTSEEIEDQGEEDRSEKHHCKKCQKDFSTRAILRRHLQIHTGTKDHKCSFCSKAFHRKSHLNRHEQAHRGEKPHECQICEKRFLYNDYLTTHMKLHSGEKDFGCDLCQKKFSTASQRKRHMISHKDDKPFSCDICEKKFVDKSYLNKHMVCHVKEKKFECEICFQKFADESRLYKHRKIHSIEHKSGSTKNQECEKCGKKFFTLYHLNTHMRIHSGEKPFKCETCGKAFNQKSSLNVHKKLHIGERNLKCKKCGMSFTQLGHLKRHSKIKICKKAKQYQICGKSSYPSNGALRGRHESNSKPGGRSRTLKQPVKERSKCQQKFKPPRSITNHLTTCQTKKADMSEKQITPEIDDPDDPDEIIGSEMSIAINGKSAIEKGVEVKNEIVEIP